MGGVVGLVSIRPDFTTEHSKQLLCQYFCMRKDEAARKFFKILIAERKGITSIRKAGNEMGETFRCCSSGHVPSLIFLYANLATLTV